MINEFLNKYKDSLIREEKIIRKKSTETDTEVRRQEKYVEMISAEQEEPFSAFTPHVTDKRKTLEIEQQKEKLEELKAQQNELNNRLAFLTQEINDVEKAESELTQKEETINKLKETSNTAINITGNQITDNAQAEKNITTQNQSENTNKIDINDLKLACSFLPADPMRAKQIIQNFIDKYNG
ncbi:MAG: hypothetical protein K6F00_12040 [Lachnospiraceae bacterium]|nr:hypothetical protein [Lachnospiraceae bacterium]